MLDLFCGAGGLSKGFLDSGAFRPVFAVDSNPWAVKTYGENFGRDHVFCERIEEIDDFPPGDVVVGGPPCQGFSLLGRNDPEHPLNLMWKHYSRALAAARPEVFVMENVPQLLRSEHYLRFRHETASAYRVAECVLNAADFGTPQVRKRAIVVGCRTGLPEDLIPVPTTAKAAWRTVGSAFAGIPETVSHGPSEAWEPFTPKAGEDLHVGRAPTAVSLERYRTIPPGGNRFDLMRLRPDLTPGCWHRKTSGGTDLMGRLVWDAPAVTIRTEFFKPEKGRYLHPTEDRPITHWEAARLQGFPNDFSFLGPKIEVARQIGNAVPVQLAFAIARRVEAYLAGEPQTTETPDDVSTSSDERRGRQLRFAEVK
ncbi:MAG: DNA cytosine methyltransferase [Dehalococcoidia bacterium]|nr:DNA cytosine methyltransferase [Dehalococcoidia bacterium]